MPKFENWSMKKLQKEARHLNMPFWRKMDRSELIELLRETWS